ncbi:hypothetical protein N1851_018895 [Merluccius polli]|uniref:Uncharacterized protein n=1 Tax=Merluccius polli TaxID=89951 RepID=A0AA47MN23_MERPO|nr:hypothetical protein N1851_018895 [Merluccius polli]
MKGHGLRKKRVAETNTTWLKLASVLDPRFKDLKCLPRGEREEVWTRLEEMLQEAAPRRWIILSQTIDIVQLRPLYRYEAEPTISIEECPLQWTLFSYWPHSPKKVNLAF